MKYSDKGKADGVSNTSMLRKPKSSEERGGNWDDNPRGRERRASRVGRKRARNEQKVRREAACSGSSKERPLPRTVGQVTCMELGERSRKAEPACDKGVGLVFELRVKCLLPHFLYFCLRLNYHPGFTAKRTYHFTVL